MNSQRPKRVVLLAIAFELIAIVAIAAAMANLISEYGMPPWAAAISAAIAIALIIAGIWISRRDTKRRLAQAAEDPSETLRRRIEHVNTAFVDAAKLMGDLQRDLEAQQAARDAILADAERQQQLLEINQEQAEKIQRILVGETKATIRAERRQQWLFFALGAMVSIPIGIAINLLVP